MPTSVEEIADGTVYRQESLRLSSGFEPAHLTFPLPRRLMRHLRQVVRIAPGVVHDRRHYAAVGGRVPLELVGDEAARLYALALQQLAEESPCSGRVSSTLDQNVKDITILWCLDGRRSGLDLRYHRNTGWTIWSGKGPREYRKIISTHEASAASRIADRCGPCAILKKCQCWTQILMKLTKGMRF